MFSWSLYSRGKRKINKKKCQTYVLSKIKGYDQDLLGGYFKQTDQEMFFTKGDIYIETRLTRTSVEDHLFR